MVESAGRGQKFLSGGLRTKVITKKKLCSPIVTVITVVRNGEELIRRTIESIVNQTYKGMEYIIIDGGSSDGTLGIIKEYEDRIDYWLSESDRGIYHAMNKGVLAATGVWVNFMNAGDIFYRSDTLELLKGYFKQNDALIYGDARRLSDGFSREQKAKPLTHLWKGLLASHQSIFVRTQVLKEVGFNTHYNLGADYDFLCKMYVQGYGFRKVDEIITVVTGGGESDMKRIEALNEIKQISGSIFKNKTTFLYFDYLILKERFKIVFKRFLPHWVKLFFVKIKYRILGLIKCF